jgi:hypothetical protein
MIENSSMMMPTVMRARVTPELYYIGFIPGVFDSEDNFTLGVKNGRGVFIPGFYIDGVFYAGTVVDEVFVQTPDADLEGIPEDPTNALSPPLDELTDEEMSSGDIGMVMEPTATPEEQPLILDDGTSNESVW